MDEALGPVMSSFEVMPGCDGIIVDHAIYDHLPVRTRSVARPPACPKSMSVFRRSPIMIVRAGSNLTLARVSLASGLIRAPIDVNYFAWMQSNIVFAGFPILMGSLSNAKRSGALMDPAPGSNPSALGYVLSSLVTRNWQPGLRVRYWKAFESFV